MMNEQVGEDESLLPEEKQISFVSCKSDDYFVVHSEVASVTQRLIEHPRVTIESQRTYDGKVVAVTARCPRSIVVVKTEPRKRSGWAPIISRRVLE